jgi:sugar-phosphatase
VLFDLDGTLVDSTASVVAAWHRVSERLGVAYEDFEPYAHGIPAGQVLDLVVPDLPAALRAELIETMLREQAEDTDEVIALPGALAALDVLPTARWAIVTSGDRRLAAARIRAAGLPLPRVLVTADDVAEGKPHPAPYLLGASRLGEPPEQCLVVEDADAGVVSGSAAGMSVLQVSDRTARSGTADAAGARGGAVAAEAIVTGLDRCRFESDRLGVTVEAVPS